ncbi:MAG: tRNA (guanosine(46)-N7)-methyltransferase TrmB [Rudaea sp.]
MQATAETQRPDELRQRRIRSFVLRQGRFTPAQQRAFEDHWSRFGLDPLNQHPDVSKIFARSAPLVLEIGFGNGEQLLWSAQNEADKNFIGIEVHRPGVGRLMNALAAHNVHNVRLYNHDAVDVLDRLVSAHSLDDVRIYFPDPWPKKRQQKRRLIQPDFIALLASRVRAGGHLYLATDWQEYAEHMLATLDAVPEWRNVAGTTRFSPRPPNRIETHFEKRGTRLGHGVWDLVYERR